MTFITKQNAGLLKSVRSWGALGLMHLALRVTLSLLIVGVVLGLTVSAQQERQSFQPQTAIKLLPEKPTPNDEIKIELSGTFPNTCAPETDSVKVTVADHQVTVATSNASEFCDEAVTRWSLSVPVGKKLAAGPYRVLVLFRMTKEPPDYLLGALRFDVAEKSANPDQAGSSSSVGGLLSITPLDKTRNDGPWVPGPLFGTIKTSKMNTFRSASPASLPISVGDTFEVETEIPGSYKNAECVAEEDAEITKSEYVQRGRDKPGSHLGSLRCHGVAKGANPKIKLLVEQAELPDLEVKLNLTLRRYTEREQVFCDVTIFTTVSNTAKGSAGVVVVLDKYKNSRSNIQRVGMSPGGQATKVDFESRLRPGVYSYEVEVKSLSIKESNTANNKAMQVVTCLARP
jgi:hypothetical protein